MSVDPALTAAEQIALDGGSHTIRRYLSVYQPTAVLTRTVYATPTWPTSTINLVGVVTTAVKRGMTAVVTRSGVLIGIYRVVTDGDGINATLNVSPLAEADAGLLNIGYRTSSILVNDTVTFYNRYDLWAMYPDYEAIVTQWREDGFRYSDWPTFHGSTDNQYFPYILNLGKHRSQFVDAGQTYATMTFSAAILTWGAPSINTYAWDIPGSWTVTAGSSSASSFTARVPAGFYILTLTLTHNTSKTTVARRCVWVHDDGANAPIPIAEITTDERTRTGRQMVLGLNDNALASLTDGAMVNYFEVCTWNGSDVPTATTNFTGWVTRESNRINLGIRRGDIGIMGPADLLKMMPAYSQYLVENPPATAPTTFQQLANGLRSIMHVVGDMLNKRAANITSLFDMNFPTSDGQQIVIGSWQLPAWAIPQGSNMLEQLQTLCRSARLNFGFDSRGALWLLQHPSETVPETAGVYSRTTVVRDYLTTHRYSLPMNFEKVKKPQCRRVRVNALCYAAAASIIAQIGESPWGSIGQGQNEDTVNDMVTSTTVEATAQTEVNNLAGQLYAMKNNPYPDMPFNIPDNRDVYEPAQMYFVANDVSASQAPDGTGWTNKNGVPLRVLKRHKNNGSASLELHLEMETAGVAGGTITVPT